MIQLRHRQPSLWHSGLAKDIEDLWEPWMKEVDQLLEDAALVESVYDAQGKRHGKSRTHGRAQTPAEVALRLLILKHVRNWSYDTLEREVRANLVYRAFTRIGDEKVPDAKTLARLGQVIGPEVIGELHERLTELARERGVVQGRKMRVDTTVVETNIHYPTDSGLLRRWSARAHANHEDGKEGYGPRGTRVISSATITRILPNKPNRPTTITREASIIFTTTTYMKC